jgi:hypothetical protein
MAETITIAGRKFPKTGVYVAAAGTAGILGWAWWTRAREDFAADEAQREIDESLPGPVEPPTDTPGFGVIGATPPKTNAEWNNFAITQLMNIGIDAVAAQAAIGKFLQRRHLTPAEAALVEQAIAAAGYPPENAPWVILRETPGTVVPPAGLPAPTGLRAIFLRWNGNTPIYRIAWNPVSGAKDYHWQHGAGSQGFMAGVSFDNQGSAPGKVDTWHIAARGVDNKIGPRATLTFTAASKTGAAPSGVPGVPGFAKAQRTGRGTYQITFAVPAGSTKFQYRRRTSARALSGWATVGTNVILRSGTFKGWARISARALYARRTTFQVEVRAGNAKGWGRSAVTNAITLP